MVRDFSKYTYGCALPVIILIACFMSLAAALQFLCYLHKVLEPHVFSIFRANIMLDVNSSWVLVCLL